jgi:hypothetical protein
VWDVNHYIKRVQTKVIADDQMFDTNMLRPIKPNTVAELRINMVPTLEDVMASGDDKGDRLAVAANGIPVKGIVLDFVDVASDSGTNKQIFLSNCGSKYAERYTYGGKSFYGIEDSDHDISKCVHHIANHTTDDMLSVNLSEADKTLGLDKTFPRAQDSRDYYLRRTSISDTIVECPELVVVFGSGDKFKAFKSRGPFKKIIIEGREAYIGKKYAIIKANVAAPVIAKTTADPVYRAAVGDKEIILMPEASFAINLGMLTDISNVLMDPDKSVREGFEKSKLTKVAVKIGKEGFLISGEPIKPLLKIANLNQSHEFTSSEAVTALHTMGMDTASAKDTLSGLVKKASLGYGDTTKLYGVNDNYIDLTPMYNMEKQASLRGMLDEYAKSIKVNLIKEASVVEDPEVVDNILSLNFINGDNILEYANYAQELRETSDKLSELLIANRMGLKDVEESAVKKSIDGIEEVIKGLNKLKMIVSEA